MLEAHGALMRIQEEEIQADCGISLAWYDVLIHLAEAPGHTLRMAELADRLALSPSWLTRRVEVMERAGLLRRCRATDDRRGVCAALTPEGVSTSRRAARSHGRSIRAHFIVDGDEARVIEASMLRVAAAAARSHLEGGS